MSVRVVIQALHERSDGAIRAVALDTLANLVETTPVLSGWARANWIANIGSPRSDDPIGSPERFSLGPQQASAVELLSYRKERGQIFITNRVPYINLLNAGSSTQAPANFVQRALLRAIRKNERRAEL